MMRWIKLNSYRERLFLMTCKRAHHHDGIKIMERFIKLERFNGMVQFIENIGVCCNKLIRNYIE